MIEALALSRSRVRAWLELARVASAPACISNVTAGFLLGGGDLFSQTGLWAASGLAALGFYGAGLMLNDLLDRETDRLANPARPIPSGKIHPWEAMGAVTLFLSAAVALVVVLFPQGLLIASALVALIMAFNLLHSRHPASVLLLGGCRGTVYLLGASAAGVRSGAHASPVWIAGFVLALYVASISLIARDERSIRTRPAQRIGAALVAVSVLAALIVLPAQGHLAALLLAFGVASAWIGRAMHAWLVRGGSAHAVVGRLLVGIPLVDAILIAGPASWLGVLIAWTCFAGVLWTQSLLEPG